jgi:dTDP-4-amino-4,6-dideoxygalactose transaminase
MWTKNYKVTCIAIGLKELKEIHEIARRRDRNISYIVRELLKIGLKNQIEDKEVKNE